MQDRAIEIRPLGLGHNNPPAAAAPWLAGIRRRGRSVEAAGRAGADASVLSLERETLPVIEPPMGRTGGSDTLATTVNLTVPTRAQAVTYAEQQGLDVRVEALPAARPSSLHVWRSNRPGAPVAGPTQVPAARVCPAGARGADRPALPDLERALINPAAVFDTPAAVLDHPRLLRPFKREILRRWAWDEYLKEVAAAEGMAEGEPSQLDAVKAALLALGETWHPHPAAPAAAPIIQAPAVADALPVAA